MISDCTDVKTGMTPSQLVQVFCDKKKKHKMFLYNVLNLAPKPWYISKNRSTLWLFAEHAEVRLLPGDSGLPACTGTRQEVLEEAVLRFAAVWTLLLHQGLV